MARALRIDKLTLAALEATLQHYQQPEKALTEIPTLRMLAAPAAALKGRCESLLPKLQSALAERASVSLCETTATVGGGALPLAELPGWAISLAPGDISLNELTERLRACDPPVIGRIRDDRFLIDPRTLPADDEDLLLHAMNQVFKD